MKLRQHGFTTYLLTKTCKKHGRSAHEMCPCNYRTYCHLLGRLWQYVLLVRWSLLWDVADACFFRAHYTCNGEGGVQVVLFQRINTAVGVGSCICGLEQRKIRLWVGRSLRSETSSIVDRVGTKDMCSVSVSHSMVLKFSWSRLILKYGV